MKTKTPGILKAKDGHIYTVQKKCYRGFIFLDGEL